MIKQFFRYHFEWVVLLSGLILMGMMNPYVDNGPSFCLFHALGVYCPGDGLGHSIAFTFRGAFNQAIQAHPFGPVAIIVLGGRIIQLWRRAYTSLTSNSENI